MRQNRNQMWAVALALVVLLAATPLPTVASAEGESEVHVKRVHRVVVECEEGSDEDCERQVRIETLGDGAHVMHVGEHGYHYSIGSAFAGKGGFLGVQLTDLTPELRAHFGVATDEGVMVAKVVDDSPAFLAGLAAGDIITRVEGETVNSSSDLTHMIRSREEGETVTLEIWREGAAETLSATLDKSERVAGHRRHVMIDCSEDDEDCEGMLMAHIHHETAIDCPDGEDCEVKIDCDDGDCDCTLNGETLDCEELLMEYDPPD